MCNQRKPERGEIKHISGFAERLFPPETKILGSLLLGTYFMKILS